MASLNRPTLERLLLYYHYLDEHVDADIDERVSSAHLARLLQMDDTQVRKDLAAIGLKGCPRVGFVTRDVMQEIRRALGFDVAYRAVVVGAGRLGGAIASYMAFGDYGLNIVAMFDADPNRVGLMIGSHVVQPADQLERIVGEHEVLLGILAVPADAAQGLADRLVQAGVKAIWNFAPTAVTVREGVVIRHEHLSVGLAELSYHLKGIRGR